MKSFIKIKETCLYIKDLKGALSFYRDKLGLDVIDYQESCHAFFRVGSSVLLCFNPDNSRHKTSPPPHYAEGNQHYAFEVSKADYEHCRKQIADAGIEIIDTLTWKNGQQSFYFHDHEKNVLEIVPEGVWGD